MVQHSVQNSALEKKTKTKPKQRQRQSNHNTPRLPTASQWVGGFVRTCQTRVFQELPFLTLIAICFHFAFMGQAAGFGTWIASLDCCSVRVLTKQRAKINLVARDLLWTLFLKKCLRSFFEFVWTFIFIFCNIDSLLGIITSQLTEQICSRGFKLSTSQCQASPSCFSLLDACTKVPKHRK